MSLYGALFSGVSGLSAESSAMGAISDNISNVNTIGYKDTEVNFQTLVTHQVSLTQYSPGGVQSKPRANIETQGLLQSTSSSTDIAISGQGLFVVNSSADNAEGSFAYTRSGSFTVDQNGDLQNVAGWYLQGWPLTDWDGTPTASHQVINGSQYMAAYKNGSTGQYTYINTGVVDPTNLQPLNLNDIAGTAAATTSISMGANLPAGVSVGNTQQSNLLEYDSLGNSHNVLLTWALTSENNWSVQATPPQGARTVTLYDNGSSSTTPQIYQTEGRLDFDQSPSTGVVSMTIDNADWNFVVGSGTNGVPANTMYAVGAPAITDATQFASTMADNINQAYLTEYSGEQATPTTTGFSDTSTVTVTGSSGSATIDLAGMTLAQAAAAITAQSATTDVTAAVTAGNTIKLTDGAGGNVTAVGTGDFPSVATAGSPQTTSAITTTGFCGDPLFAAGSTVTVTDAGIPGPGDVTVSIAGLSASAAAAAIQTAVQTAMSPATTFTATYSATTGKITFEDTGQGFTVTGVNDGASLAGVSAAASTPLAKTPTSTGGVGPTTLTVTGPNSVGGGTAVTIAAGATLAEVASDVDQAYSTTGVHAYVNGTQIAYYTGLAGGCTVTGTAGLDAASVDAAFTGTGLTYASQVAGTGSVVFSNFDTVNSVDVSGLTSVLNSSPYSYTPSLTGGGVPSTFVTPSTISVTGPSGAATVTVSGMTLAEAAVAITSDFSSTGVAAVVSGNSLVFIPKAGSVTLSGTGDAASLASTYSTSGSELVEQTGVTTGDTDGFSLSKVASEVYSGTAGTITTPPETPAIVFNGNGTPEAINVGSMAITWANGSQDQTTQSSLTASPPISLNFGSVDSSNGMTQLAPSNSAAPDISLVFMDQNGAKFGNFTGLTIGSNGIVTATFDNGVTRPIFQIPIATFVDADGLQGQTGDIFTSSDFSGLPTLRVPGSSGSGQINDSSLEASTVDIGSQFTEMIVTQRAYSAAAKIITTTNQMLDDLINIVRA